MTDEAMGPLRRRMIEDMTIRKLALLKSPFCSPPGSPTNCDASTILSKC
jgi:hypothetical protein